MRISHPFPGLVPGGYSCAVAGRAWVGAVLERLAKLLVEVAGAEQAGEEEVLDAATSVRTCTLGALTWEGYGAKIYSMVRVHMVFLRTRIQGYTALKTPLMWQSWIG